MSTLRQVSRVLGVTGAQAIPLGGVLGFGWGTATGIALYWVESLLLVLAAVILIVLVRQRTAEQPGEPDDARAARGRRRDQANRWRLNAGEVFGFHFVSMLAFGVFMAGAAYAVTRGGVLQEFDVAEFQRGVLGLVACIGLGMAADVWQIDTLPPASVGRRVKVLMRRWLFFWTLGFFGPMLTALFDAPRAIFGLFGGLKAVWEVHGAVERLAPGAVGADEPPRSVYEQRKVTLGGIPHDGARHRTLPD